MRHESRWREESTEASACSSSVVRYPWVSTISVTSPRSRRSSVTTVSWPGSAPVDQGCKRTHSAEAEASRLLPKRFLTRAQRIVSLWVSKTSYAQGSTPCVGGANARRLLGGSMCAQILLSTLVVCLHVACVLCNAVAVVSGTRLCFYEKRTDLLWNRASHYSVLNVL